MPVSVVCDAASVVNAALRESISNSTSNSGSSNCSTQHHHQNNNSQNNVNQNYHRNDSDDNDDDDEQQKQQQNLQNKLIASTKRILLTKIEYEEVSSYNQSVLDTLKSKYIILRPTNNNGKINQSNTNASSTITTTSNTSAPTSSTNKGDGDKEKINHQNQNTSSTTQNAISGKNIIRKYIKRKTRNVFILFYFCYSTENKKVFEFPRK